MVEQTDTATETETEAATEAAETARASQGGEGADGGSVDPGAAADAPAIDLALIPEQFVTDGQPDFKAFREAFDDAAAFRATEQERQSALPESADGYEFNVPALTDLQLPEGVTLPEGTALALDADDPGVKALKAVAHEHRLPQAAVDSLAKVWAQREVNETVRMVQEHGEQMKKLGPDGKSRLSAVQRTLGARLPEAQAGALFDSITDADALRAVETLIGGRQTLSSAPPSAGIDHSQMSPGERIALGLEMRGKQRKSA